MSVIWSGVTEEGAIVPVQVTDEGKVVAVGDGPEGEYLKLTGGNLTGDLTVNEQITLSAGNGSGTFAGGVTRTNVNPTSVGDYGYRVVYGSDLPGENTYLGTRLNGANQAFAHWNGSELKAGVDTDGNATFAGNVQVGGDPNDGTNVGSRVLPSGFIQAARESGASAVWSGYTQGTAGPTSRINGDGSAMFAGGKCGFTSAGELFFTSRNERYKLIVSNGLCQAEPYTRQMELKEKAEQRIADKRETKPSDPSDPSDLSEVTTDNDNA